MIYDILQTMSLKDQQQSLEAAAAYASGDGYKERLVQDAAMKIEEGRLQEYLDSPDWIADKALLEASGRTIVFGYSPMHHTTYYLGAYGLEYLKDSNPQEQVITSGSGRAVGRAEEGATSGAIAAAVYFGSNGVRAGTLIGPIDWPHYSPTDATILQGGIREFIELQIGRIREQAPSVARRAPSINQPTSQ